MRSIEAASLKIGVYGVGGDVPEYAILSHTWGRTEVSLQEFADPSLGAKETSTEVGSGYWKIKKACEQALKDGLEYVWVDTCCIDKTSSTELSEAINSMFRWYREAEVCYAYLYDIVGDSYLGDSNDSDYGEPWGICEDKAELLAHSRWFKRGWTLQELIAPENVQFYDRDWDHIGDKWQLRKSLESITGVSTDVLCTGKMEDEGIAKRMSWMTGRETTRPEDMAYSLLGIFDVNMPLLYGEGDKAFVRLQGEIMKDSADHSLFAWNTLNSSLYYRKGEPLLAPIFADWPNQFKNSSIWDKRRLDEDVAGESYALTNLGVHIKLRLKRHDHWRYGNKWGRDYEGRTFVAMLECRFIDEAGAVYKMCRPGIFLVQISPPRPQYARISNAGIVPTTTSREAYESLLATGSSGSKRAVLFTEEDALQTIYLRKKIPGWAQVPRK